MKFPTDLDPRTLRWVADVMESDAAVYDAIATDGIDLAKDGRAIDRYHIRAAELRIQMRQFRNRATRIERERAGKGEGR